jgi:hypothetical protein
MYKYIFILGNGRSGTNWLNEIINLSSKTHCRNEPNDLSKSPFSKLPNPWIKLDKKADIAPLWNNAIKWSSRTIWERDKAPSVLKDFIKFPKLYHLMYSITRHKKIRNLISFFLPSLRGSEWIILPNWLTEKTFFENAVKVFKFTQVPGWASWIVHNQPEAIILHIVRHPGGFLNSWKNRWLNLNSKKEVAEANRKRLYLITKSDSKWKTLFGDIDVISVEESELWFWRYACETIHKSCMKSQNYKLIIYDDLVKSPVEISKSIYSLCKLPWTKEIETKILESSINSKQIANAWKNKLNKGDIRLVNKILKGSIMETWWNTSKK